METETVFVFTYVSTIFVEKELKGLKRRKAAGIDGIPPGPLKDASSVLAKPLAFLINLSLQTETVPNEWKIAKVVAVHKGGSKEDKNNFRPISVLPVISKILERAVHHQLVQYLEENNILSKNKFGYRKKRSTELATLLLIDEMSKEIDKGKMVGAVSIDLSKAFDTLSHSVLISKMQKCGVKGIAIQWFIDYLFNRSIISVIDDQRSEPQSLICGVPQGSILGPILFLMYFNDFEQCLSHSRVYKFADDTVIFVPRSQRDDIESDLNSDLQGISEYFRINELVINLKKGKSESMLFGTSKKLSSADSIKLKYDHHCISSTQEYKYLGTILDQSLSFRRNFEALYKRMSSRLRLLSSLKYLLPTDTIIKIYEAILFSTFPPSKR